MRLKVTIGYTIVVAALFVIALMYEGESATTTKLHNDANVAVPNRLEQVAALDYSDFSRMYLAPEFAYRTFILAYVE